MKKFLFLSIIATALSTPAMATTVNIGGTSMQFTPADSLIGTSGAFDESASPYNQIDPTTTAFKNIVTSDPGTYVYGHTSSTSAKINLGFSTNVFSHAGTDLAIYTIGNGYSFYLDVFDTNNTSMLSQKYDVNVSDATTSCLTGISPCMPVSVKAIDLGTSFNGRQIGKISIDIGNNYFKNYTQNGQMFTAYSNFALAGSVTPVPLPLPIILFSSGLALLGWVGHKKTA